MERIWQDDSDIFQEEKNTEVEKKFWKRRHKEENDITNMFLIKVY